MNCTMLREYVTNNCGMCNYNYTKHLQFTKDCINRTDYINGFECIKSCPISNYINSALVVIVIALLFVLGAVIVMSLFKGGNK